VNTRVHLVSSHVTHADALHGVCLCGYLHHIVWCIVCVSWPQLLSTLAPAQQCQQQCPHLMQVVVSFSCGMLMSLYWIAEHTRLGLHPSKSTRVWILCKLDTYRYFFTHAPYIGTHTAPGGCFSHWCESGTNLLLCCTPTISQPRQAAHGIPSCISSLCPCL
jgi:hypothetical protein